MSNLDHGAVCLRRLKNFFVFFRKSPIFLNVVYLTLFLSLTLSIQYPDKIKEQIVNIKYQHLCPLHSIDGFQGVSFVRLKSWSLSTKKILSIHHITDGEDEVRGLSLPT